MHILFRATVATRLFKRTPPSTHISSNPTLPGSRNYGVATGPPGVADALAVFAFVTPVLVRENDVLRL